MLFEQPDRVLVDRGAAHAHGGRRTEVIKEALTAAAAAAAARPLVHERRHLVAASVARETQLRQDYFLPAFLPAPLAAGAFALAAGFGLALGFPFGAAFFGGAGFFAGAGFSRAGAAAR